MSNTTNLRSQLAYQVIQEVQKAVIGKEDRVRKVMMAILSGGHVLLEDIPGVGKTTMALAFSKALSLKEKRLTFTPDVLPADLTGFTMYRKETGEFYFHPGARCAISFWAMKSTAPRPKPSLPSWKSWRKGRSAWTAVPIPCQSLLSSLLPRIPPALLAPSFCRSPSWIVSVSVLGLDIPTWKKKLPF